MDHLVVNGPEVAMAFVHWCVVVPRVRVRLRVRIKLRVRVRVRVMVRVSAPIDAVTIRGIS